MSKVLILAPQGFGKTTSIGQEEGLGILGLSPKETFIISGTTKPLSFKNSSRDYKVCDPQLGPPTVENGNRYITNDGYEVSKVVGYVTSNRKDIKNIVLDDSNYWMQDYFMANSLKKGYDTFKVIGDFMGKIFASMEAAPSINFFMMAHPEEYTDNAIGGMSYRFKTVGKMVQDYITPEGKFEIVLYGKQSYDAANRKVVKQFVTNFDGQFPAKSPYGMFDLYIPNDLGFVKKTIEEYYGIG